MNSLSAFHLCGSFTFSLARLTAVFSTWGYLPAQGRTLASCRCLSQILKSVARQAETSDPPKKSKRKPSVLFFVFYLNVKRQSSKYILDEAAASAAAHTATVISWASTGLMVFLLCLLLWFLRAACGRKLINPEADWDTLSVVDLIALSVWLLLWHHWW